MSSLESNNKRIAKNTILLYLRMLLIIAVSLYTSRVVLNTLGVSDYGVYNVVGGFVAMLSFLNSALTAASQRFISFELGRGDKEKLKTIFCTSVTIHAILAIIIFFIAETVGLWFVNTHLNIEPTRMTAANWVYQCSILTFMLSIISVPYNSCIVAHEHMKAFAYISIFEVTLKLLVVYLLLIISYDKLIIYAILIALVGIIIRLFYGIYCKSHFDECSYHFVFNKIIFKDMFSFAGWSVFGGLAFPFREQASNVILNIFCGTIINAARGIAFQVNGVISNFSNNFIMALNPQIVKQYASGNIEKSSILVHTGIRYSFFLILIIIIPIIINVDYVLKLWLGTVPKYTSSFLYLTLICALINSMTQPIVAAIQATGKIKIFQISICIIMLLELPFAYFILYNGAEPYAVMYPTIFVSVIGLFARYIILKQLVPLYKLKYFTIIVLKNLTIGFICFCLSKYIQSYFNINFFTFILTSITSIFIVIIVVYYLGITYNERSKLKNKLKELKYKYVKNK